MIDVSERLKQLSSSNYQTVYLALIQLNIRQLMCIYVISIVSLFNTEKAQIPK